MVKAVIIQRVVPHYRVPVFEELYRRLGWRVACADAGPSLGLNLAHPDDHEWLIPFNFIRSSHVAYAARVPLADIMSQTRPEALVAEFSIRMSSTWRLALAGCAVAFAFWSQGWNRERGFTSPADYLVQNLRLAIMRRADAQIVYSEECAQFVTDRLGDKMPVFVARNTLAMDKFQGRDIDAGPRDLACPHIICVGRLTANKHVPLVVEAFRRIRDAFPGARMTVVGDGPDRPAVEAAAALCHGAVTLAGEIYDDDVLAQLFQSASLSVIGGSVGLSVNHALAYGVPVMIFDDRYRHRHHPEHAYVIDGVSGYRVPGASVEDLASALRNALAAPGPRAKLAATLCDYADRELSLERMVQGFVKLDAFFEQRA